MDLLIDNGLVNGGWLFDRVDGLFNGLASEVGPISPPVDLVEDPEGYRFSIDLPGLKTDSLEVKVDMKQYGEQPEVRRNRSLQREEVDNALFCAEVELVDQVVTGDDFVALGGVAVCERAHCRSEQLARSRPHRLDVSFDLLELLVEPDPDVGHRRPSLPAINRTCR